MPLERIAIYLLILVAAFSTGFVKGCAHNQQQYKEAETRFVERVKVVKEIERVEVPKFIKQIQWLKETEVKLVEAANAEPINVPSCNLSDDRVRRINQAAAGNP